ncbi:hypothetical protein K9N50_04025 [bacterium]|nr:hypothetical protein [bacterium]
MFRLFTVLLIILSLNQLIIAQPFDSFTVIPENPIEGEDIVTKFEGEFNHTGFDIYTEDFEIGDHELSIIIGIIDYGVGGQMITPFKHNHIWGELDEGEWELNTLVRFYYWYEEEMEDPELEDQFSWQYGFDVGEAEDEVRFYMEFRRGWQLISFPIIPNERDVTELFAELAEDDDRFSLKDCNGNFYYPRYDFNSITEWEPLQAYSLKLGGYYREIIFTGCHHEERMETPIQLTEGWNFVAYLPDREIPAETAFRNISEQLVMAKDCSGNFYSPENNYCNMYPLKRRQGYFVKVSEDCELVWNTEE